LADLAAVAALGTAPIAGPNPAGVSARYEADFEKLAAEIAKLESVDGRNSMHWDTVVESATSVLSGKSKDLLVASYLTLGLLQNNGYKGLAAGLSLCKNMLNTFWDGLFPEVTRLRARAQALQWMADRVAPVLNERPSASKSDREPLTTADEALKEIDTLIASKIEEGAPSFQECQRALSDKLSSIPSDESPPSETGQASGSESAPQEEAPGREIDSPAAAWESLTPMRERRIKAAEVFRGANLADPLPYRLLRQAVWEFILEAPPAPEGISAWTGGDAAFAADQEAALDKGDYAAVINACETRLVGDQAWLDLNFFVAKAMEGLGKPYAAAKRAVGDAVAHLVRGFPTLLDIKFADGTPMASEGTRLWILHELSAIPEKGKAAAGGLETAVTEARKLLARKNFREGTALLEKEMRSAMTRRERFVAKLALARLCVEGGRSDLALPQLEGLDEEARKFALEEWEPVLVAEVARELWRCHKASATPERATEFYQRLCRLDLGAALAMDGKK
jgi:type VI secretion system protein VasJ